MSELRLLWEFKSSFLAVGVVLTRTVTEVATLYLRGVSRVWVLTYVANLLFHFLLISYCYFRSFLCSRSSLPSISCLTSLLWFRIELLFTYHTTHLTLNVTSLQIPARQISSWLYLILMSEIKLLESMVRSSFTFPHLSIPVGFVLVNAIFIDYFEDIAFLFLHVHNPVLLIHL